MPCCSEAGLDFRIIPAGFNAPLELLTGFTNKFLRRGSVMKKNFCLVLLLVLSLVISCAPRSHFGVTYRAIMPPSDFDRTEAAIAQAEKSQGAKYCPEKIAKAKELGKKAVETYLACRTDEALQLLAEARQLAKEAEGCQPPPLTPVVPAPPRPAPPAPAPPAPAPPAPH